jgi:hypothetical protein
MRWAGGRVARMKELRSFFIFVGKPERKKEPTWEMQA